MPRHYHVTDTSLTPALPAYIKAVARAMLELARPEGGRRERLELFLQSARLEVMGLLSAAAMESYSRAYPFLVRLHALSELRHGWDAVEMARRRVMTS